MPKDELVDALNRLGSLTKDIKETEYVEDERTFTIPKKYLKNAKEGQIVSFKVLLDDKDGYVLLPETSIAWTDKKEDEEDEIKEITEHGKRLGIIKDDKKEDKKDVKTILSEKFDEADKMAVAGEK